MGTLRDLWGKVVEYWGLGRQSRESPPRDDICLILIAIALDHDKEMLYSGPLARVVTLKCSTGGSTITILNRLLDVARDGGKGRLEARTGVFGPSQYRRDAV